MIAFAGVFVFTSCEKDPDWDDLDYNYIVQTDYKEGTDFDKYSLYSVNDTVYVIGSSNSEDGIEKWVYSESARARGMIDQVIKNMNDRGYIVADAAMEKPELTFQLVYIQDMRYYWGYYGSWWDYWGYWTGSNWGYYPYPVVYSYAVGSVIVDMLDNNGEPIQNPGEHKPRKPVIWNAYATGQLSSSNQFNQEVAEWSINQAFNQSPYLRKKILY